MSLLLAGLLASVSGAAFGWLVRRRATRIERDEATLSDAPAASSPAPDPFDAMPCRVGDVVVRATGEEAWLAGALVLEEKRVVAALFVAPQAGGARVLFATPAPDATLLWLTPVAESDASVHGEPPTSLEIGRVRFERVRQRPLVARAVGDHAPDVQGTVLVAEYEGAPAERLVLVRSPRATWVYRGTALLPSTYDVLSGG